MIKFKNIKNYRSKKGEFALEAEVLGVFGLIIGTPIAAAMTLSYALPDIPEENNNLDLGTAIIINGDNATLIEYDSALKDEVSDGIEYKIHTDNDETITVVDNQITDVYFVNEINSKNIAISKAEELVGENGVISEYDTKTKTLKLIKRK